jgi:DNA repair exonuclease SbcCD ATPase subunit
MSHDRGCSCGRERWDYADCTREDCMKREPPLDPRSEAIRAAGKRLLPAIEEANAADLRRRIEDLSRRIEEIEGIDQRLATAVSELSCRTHEQIAGLIKRLDEITEELVRRNHERMTAIEARVADLDQRTKRMVRMGPIDRGIDAIDEHYLDGLAEALRGEPPELRMSVSDEMVRAIDEEKAVAIERSRQALLEHMSAATLRRHEPH